jgi:exonuclease SbcC
MLNKLTLQYFRRHESLSIDFTTGINVIRGANEAGKTTIHQAISYALFGAKALGQPIDEVVTWGIEPRKLKVTLVLTVGGVKHTFTRSKGSAEVVVDLFNGPFVTGQIEVSNFAASLLGADATSASKLLMASQNGIRGALEEGPKALSEMIEDLPSPSPRSPGSWSCPRPPRTARRCTRAARS